MQNLVHKVYYKVVITKLWCCSYYKLFELKDCLTVTILAELRVGCTLNQYSLMMSFV